MNGFWFRRRPDGVFPVSVSDIRAAAGERTDGGQQRRTTEKRRLMEMDGGGGGEVWREGTREENEPTGRPSKNVVPAGR